jgi:hypothetical protein
MFPLPRPARSILVTLLLAAGTIVPTLYVFAFVWRVGQSGHVREVEAALGQALGLHVSLESVRHPKPETDEFTGVVLRREEAAGGTRLIELARADRLTLTRDAGRQVIRAEGLRLRGESPAEMADQCLAAARRLVEQGRAELVASEAQVELIRDGERITLTVYDLAAVASSKRDEFELSSSYRVGPARSAGRCELRLAQKAASGPARTTLSVQTMEGDLPVTVLGPLVDAARWFGPDARMQGEIRASWGPREPETIAFQGELDRVSLSHLVEDHFPGRRLRGTARLVVDSAVWSDLPGAQGRGWSQARGQIEAGPGSIGRDLLAALVDALGFRTSGLGDLDADDVPFQGLGLAFALNSGGELTLTGALGKAHADDVVISAGDADGPLVRQPEGTASVRGLWKALLLWDADVLVPATAESRVLRHLPLPRTLSEPQRSMPAN